MTQKIESPKFVISVPAACRSSMRMATDAIRSTTTVTVAIAISRSLRCVWVGVSPRNTRFASSQAARVDSHRMTHCRTSIQTVPAATWGGELSPPLP